MAFNLEKVLAYRATERWFRAEAAPAEGGDGIDRIYIDGVIGGGFFCTGTGAKEFREAAAALTAPTLEVHINSPGGSGKQAAVEGLKIYGKTGTAELGPRNKLRHITHFICFVKYRSRRYAAAITVEDGVSGGRSCAPLAAAFFQNYLEPDALDALDYN